MSQSFETPDQIVDEYLWVVMIPDPDAAHKFTSPNLEIIFTGGRRMSDPSHTAAFNAKRYQWVKKRIERTETVAGGAQEETVVYSLGTLHGV